MSEELLITKLAANLANMSDAVFRQKSYRMGIQAVYKDDKLYYSLDQIEKIKNYKGARNSPYDLEEHDDIITYWKTTKNNTSPEIAKKFGVATSQVNAIINRYLDGLKPRI